MNTQIIALLIRHGLTLFAGYLVTSGFLTSAQTEQFIGAVLFIGTLFWSYFNKKSLTAEPSE